jgi:3D (Asp-Asp-Asp) domain-containing protein
MFKSILISALMMFSLITQAAKRLDISQFKFHKISASELPSDNAIGNMEEIIEALNYQIKNCNENKGKFQTVTIANRLVKRQEWCLDTSQKMLTYAIVAQGDFKKFLTSIKTEFDWYKSDGWPEKHGFFKKGDFKFTAYYTPNGNGGSHKPYGSENNPLTAHASCATDPRIIPVGMIFIHTSKKSTSWCIAQDSGSAVLGAHVDLYKGKGDQAGVEVENLFYAGSLFVALPKSE